MTHIVYVGSNSVDWNTELKESELTDLGATYRIDGEGKKTFTFLEDKTFQLESQLESDTSKIYLHLMVNVGYRFDKNPRPKYEWEIMDQLRPLQRVDKVLGNCLQRPGGGATNNLHVAATLARSMGSNISLDLLVLQESRFTQKVFNNELGGANYAYNSIRQSQKEMNNTSLSSNPEKITFTSKEDPFCKQDSDRLNDILNQKIRDDKDMLVINSVKDEKYLSSILGWYHGYRGTKPIVVAAVTNSMLSQKANRDNIRTSVARSDIYVSNIEELYGFLEDLYTKKEENMWGELYKGLEDFYPKKKKDKWEELDDNDLYEGIRYILKAQQKAGKKGKVYVTCGDNGAAVMDSNGILFYQGICFIKRSPTQKSPNVDLNGAGDTFAGVMTLLEGLGGYSAPEILSYANAASQLCIIGRGANEKDRITVDSINNFNRARRQEILKYDERTKEFCPYSILTCNLS